MQPALELGAGAKEVLSVPGTGRVVGVYSKAAYLQLPAGLVALTSFDVPSGPVHARTSGPLNGLRLGAKVVVTESFLQAGPVLLELSAARPWRGSLPDAGQLEQGREQALELLRKAPAPAVDPAAQRTAAHLISRGDIHAAARGLGGLGPGLTPAGDDCLAGILLIAYIRFGSRSATILSDVAAGVPTNLISRAFLHWAARGQSIEPIHRFLTTAAGGDSQSAATALEELTGFGHSSGADLAAGLTIGLRHFEADNHASLK